MNYYNPKLLKITEDNFLYNCEIIRDDFEEYFIYIDKKRSYYIHYFANSLKFFINTFDPILTIELKQYEVNFLIESLELTLEKQFYNRLGLLNHLLNENK